MSENPEEPKADGSAQDSKKARSPYSKLPFDLTPEELAQTGTQKMFLGEVDRLNIEVGNLKDFERKYHAVNAAFLVLESKFLRYTALEILYTMGIAASFAALGYLIRLPSWETRHRFGFWLSIVIVIVACWAKWHGGRSMGAKEADAK
jgi:hypothetical protein